jgi:hypothetical protein
VRAPVHDKDGFAHDGAMAASHVGRLSMRARTTVRVELLLQRIRPAAIQEASDAWSILRNLDHPAGGLVVSDDLATSATCMPCRPATDVLQQRCMMHAGSMQGSFTAGMRELLQPC